MSGVRINVLPGTVVGGPENVGVPIKTKRAHFVHDAADACVVLNDRVSIFNSDGDLWMNSGAGRFGWWTFMKLMLMKNG